MRAKDEATLKRDIGWYGSFSMGYADVGADMYVALGLVAIYAAGASPIAFAIASITYVATGLAYVELASVYPYAGGAQVYAMKAFNDLVGFIAGWAVMLDYTVDIALFALATAGYLSFLFPSVKAYSISLALINIRVEIPYLGIVAFILVISLLFLNISGIRESSRFNELLTGIGILVLTITLIIGFIFAFSLASFIGQIFIFGSPSALPHISYIFPQQNISLQNFIYGITIAMTSFIGIESIAQAAEETKRPYKWIPRAGKLSIISVVIFTLGFSTLSIGVLPWGSLAASQNNSMSTIASTVPMIGEFLAILVAIVGVLMCYVSTNTGIIGTSRVVFSMGRFEMLPKWFYKVHRKFRTPYRAILMFGLIGAALAFIGDLPLVADLYNFGALLSYIIVNISLISLRNTEPDAYRPWRIPGDLTLKLGDKTLIIPIISVIGAVTCTAIWLLIVGFHPNGRLIGTLWVGAGIIGFLIYRRAIRLSPISTAGGKSIVPAGRTMNALVLLRTPEDEDSVVSALKEHLDRRFKLTLLNIIDSVEFGLSIDRPGGYELVKQLEQASLDELNRIAERLRGKGFECKARVDVGPLNSVLEEELKHPENDVIVMIKRKTRKVGVKGEDTFYTIVSKYSGRLMVIRRSDQI